MAKEIVVWCDACLAEEVRTPSREWRLAVGFEAKTIDLCDAHSDQYVKPLATLLEEYGAPVEVGRAAPTPARRVKTTSVHEPSKGQSGELTLLNYKLSGNRMGRRTDNDRLTQCLWCPLDYANDNSSGFGRHLQAVHGIEERLKVFAGLCPVCGGGPFSMMGSHLGKAHADFDFKSITAAFLWAREHGDPHGAYAAVLSKAQVIER